MPYSVLSVRDPSPHPSFASPGLNSICGYCPGKTYARKCIPLDPRDIKSTNGRDKRQASTTWHCSPSRVYLFQPILSCSASPHIPPAVTDAEIKTTIAGLRALILDLHLATKLYDAIDGLPPPFFVGQRMKPPFLAFEIRSISPFQNGSEVGFRAQAGALGAVEIKTKQSLMQLDSLYPVYPWIDFLLNRQPVRSTIETIPEDSECSVLHFRRRSSGRSITLAFGCDTDERADDVHEFLVRLGRPFDALLLAPTQLNVSEYQRIATESLIAISASEGGHIGNVERIDTECTIAGRALIHSRDYLFFLLQSLLFRDFHVSHTVLICCHSSLCYCVLCVCSYSSCRYKCAVALLFKFSSVFPAANDTELV